MSLSRVLLEVDKAWEGFATEITLKVNWGRVLAFKVPGHASAVHPGWTLGALHLAFAWKAGKVRFFKSEPDSCPKFFRIKRVQRGSSCSLLSKLFALIHAMGHSEMVFQDWPAFIILATLRTVIKQWFSMGPLYMPGQTGWMENLFTVGTFHFTTWNRLSSTWKFLREGTFGGFHAQFVDAPSYCRSFWTLWNTVGTLLVQRPCAELWCVSAGLYALSTFGNAGRLACLERILHLYSANIKDKHKTATFQFWTSGALFSGVPSGWKHFWRLSDKVHMSLVPQTHVAL